MGRSEMQMEALLHIYATEEITKILIKKPNGRQRWQRKINGRQKEMVDRNF